MPLGDLFDVVLKAGGGLATVVLIWFIWLFVNGKLYSEKQITKMLEQQVIQIADQKVAIKLLTEELKASSRTQAEAADTLDTNQINDILDEIVEKIKRTRKEKLS
jgi:hypothetical protein